MKQSKTLYDFSEYPEDHQLHDVSNKKRAGKFKDEMSSKIITEFVGLRAKMYSLKTDDEHVNKKANGIKKSVVEREIKFDDYKRSLCGTTKTDLILCD